MCRLTSVSVTSRSKIGPSWRVAGPEEGGRADLGYEIPGSCESTMLSSFMARFSWLLLSWLTACTKPASLSASDSSSSQATIDPTGEAAADRELFEEEELARLRAECEEVCERRIDRDAFIRRAEYYRAVQGEPEPELVEVTDVPLLFVLEEAGKAVAAVYIDSEDYVISCMLTSPKLPRTKFALVNC